MWVRRLATATVLAAALGGCAQSTGDLGRAPSGVYARDIAPAVDRYVDGVSTNTLTFLPLTENETEMRDRMWRFFAMPPMGEILWKDNKATTKSAIFSIKKISTDTGRYYTFLSAQNYQSTPALYRRVEGDINADLATLPGVFASICTVQRNDIRRRAGLAEFSDLDPKTRQAVSNQIARNKQGATLFAGVLSFRYQSYKIALERLIVERPDPRARQVDHALSRLAVMLKSAQNNAYCTKPPTRPILARNAPIRLDG